MSFGGDIKPSGPGEPLKISLSAIGSFLVSWVISSKPIYKKKKKIHGCCLLVSSCMGNVSPYQVSDALPYLVSDILSY